MTPAANAPVAPVVIKLPPRRKLLPLDFFTVLHGVDNKTTIILIEDQQLWPAFNLAISEIGKRKVHLWRDSIEQWQPGRARTPRMPLPHVLAAILPPLGLAPAAAVTLRASELAYRWCLKPDSISNLITAGELKEIGTHKGNESPRVSRASIEAFLSRRLL